MPTQDAATIARELSEAADSDIHDALGGLLLVAGLTEVCSGHGVQDAEELGLVRHIGNCKWEETPLGRAVAAELTRPVPVGSAISDTSNRRPARCDSGRGD